MKLLKLIFTIAVLLASVPLIDRVVKFFVDNTHRYSTDESFDLI